MAGPAARAGRALAPAPSHLSVSTRSLLSGSFRFLKKQSEGEFSAGTSVRAGPGEVPPVGGRDPSPKATRPSPSRPTWRLTLAAQLSLSNREPSTRGLPLPTLSKTGAGRSRGRRRVWTCGHTHGAHSPQPGLAQGGFCTSAP